MTFIYTTNTWLKHYVILILIIISYCNADILRLLRPYNHMGDNITKQPDMLLMNLRILLKNVMLTDFDNSDFMIHYDSTSTDFVENLMIELADYDKERDNFQNARSLDCVCFVKNYENLPANEAIINPKIKFYLLHLVFLNDISKFEDANSKIFDIGDSVIFICLRELDLCNEYFQSNKNNMETFESSYLMKQLYSIMILQVVKDEISLFLVCYYCGNKTERFQLQFNDSITNNINTISGSIINLVMININYSYKNLHGHNFFVEAPMHGRNFECVKPQQLKPLRNGRELKCESISGTEGNMLLETSKKLNFTFTLVNYFSEKSKGRTVTAVKNGYVDWAVGSLTVTSKRNLLVTFSATVGSDPVKIIYSESRSIYKQAYLLVDVFSMTTWLVLCCSIIIQTILLFITFKYYNVKGIVPFNRMLWSIGLHLVEKPLIEKMTVVGKSTITIWLLCCIAISTLYKAKLSSFQTSPPLRDAKSLEALLKEGYTAQYMMIESGFIGEEINITTDKVLQQLQKNVVVKTDMCECIKDLSNEKIFFLHEMTTLRMAINDGCYDFLNKNDLMSLRVTHDDIFSSFHAWAYRDESPYSYRINTYITRFKETGLAKKWGDKVQNPPQRHPLYFNGKKVINDDKVTVEKRLYGFFLLWAAGIVISILSFIVELTNYYFKSPCIPFVSQ